MPIAELVAASFSSAEAVALNAFVYTDADRDALAQAAREILTEYLPLPGACALMSAVYAEAIAARSDMPAYVVAGTLDVDGQRVFGRTPLAKGPSPFLRSDLDWDGHMWVIVGDRIADISLLRTTKSAQGHPALKRVAAREFGSNTGIVIWSVADAREAGLYYRPGYVLTKAEVEGLANGGRATLPRA